MNRLRSRRSKTRREPDLVRRRFAPLYVFMAYAKAAQENPSPAAMAILTNLAEAGKAGIKAKQKEK
jgi:hypothetical protein